MNRLRPGDLYPVTADESLELMVHHLCLAHVYFMNTSENLQEVREEVRRLLEERSELAAFVEINCSWVEALQLEYEDMKKDY